MTYEDVLETVRNSCELCMSAKVCNEAECKNPLIAKALKKQIARKPKLFAELDGGKITEMHYECPECGNALLYDVSYCPEQYCDQCGQKIRSSHVTNIKLI